MTPPRRITVVGAGVIGLTTALDLAAAGHDVTVLTADPPAATTSAIAGAIWFPYQVGPPDLVAGCQQRGIPLVLANARFNATSLRKSQRLGALARPAYGGLTAIRISSSSQARPT